MRLCLSRADRGRPRSRARAGNHPPRSEAGEHQNAAGRRGQGARLRPGQGARPCAQLRPSQVAHDHHSGDDRVGRHSWHGCVHEPGAGRGQLDRRTDIWAFGCVLFEMLTGIRAFSGETLTDTIGAIVSSDPDWQVLPADASPVRRLLARCLKKDPKQRLQAIGDARIQIES